MSLSEQSSQLKEYLITNIKPFIVANFGVQLLRTEDPSRAVLPEDIQQETMNLGGIEAERLSTQAATPQSAILYFHGGAWSGGSPQSVRQVTWRLAKLTNVPVYVPVFRLAPEHPYPAGLDDCVQTYHALLEQGISASSIVVAGDSSGGNTALALVHRLRAANMPLPGGVVGISSVTDLTGASPSHKTNAELETILPPDLIEIIRDLYAPGADWTNPFLSPLYGDLTGFPPSFLQAGGDEMLVDDSRRMAAKLQAAGVEVVLDIAPELWHDYVMMADQIPEAQQSLERIAAFITSHLQ
jgi:acetyl esterase/lipase